MIEGFRKKYLERLGLDPAAEWPLTAQTLATIQEAHLSKVPFEIIDSMMGTPIDLRPEALFDKIVIRRRGGFCYELNGLLALLLEDLGFSVERLAGWVPSCKGKFDHIFLRVEAEGQLWLVDAGFRNGALLPLLFDIDAVQDGIKADYKIVAADASEANTEGFGEESWWLMRKPKGSDEWLQAYRFDRAVYELNDYKARCKDFTEGGWSPFQRRPSCSLETCDGEIYLNDDIFVDVVDGQLVERKVKSSADFAQILLRTFGVMTDGGDMLHAVCADDELMHVHEVVALEKEITSGEFTMRALMERAGSAAATAVAGVADLQTVKPWDERAEKPLIMVLAGNGNNGGDGWVIADILHQNDYNVILASAEGPLGMTAKPGSNVAEEIMFRINATIATNGLSIYQGGVGEPILNVEIGPDEMALSYQLKHCDVVVDAMLGTGFKKDKVRKPFSWWIDLVNEAHEAGIPVISVDVPSGMSAQTGAVAKNCVKADATITMLRAKKGMLTEGTEEYVGRLFVADLED